MSALSSWVILYSGQNDILNILCMEEEFLPLKESEWLYPARLACRVVVREKSWEIRVKFLLQRTWVTGKKTTISTLNLLCGIPVNTEDRYSPEAKLTAWHPEKMSFHRTHVQGFFQCEFFADTHLYSLTLTKGAFCPHIIYGGENGLVWEFMNDTRVQHGINSSAAVARSLYRASPKWMMPLGYNCVTTVLYKSFIFWSLNPYVCLSIVLFCLQPYI